MIEFPQTTGGDWYLRKGNGGPVQWFDDTPLESVLAMAILMTGAGDLAGADQVTLLDKDKHAIVTFVANEKHQGCHMVIPHDSQTSSDDLEQLRCFMIAYRLMWNVQEPKESVEQT